MIVLAVLWVVLVLCEGLAYIKLPLGVGWGRRLWLGMLLVLILASTALRLWASWQAWLIFCVLGLYRIVNILRFWVGRLPEPQLRSVALRAHGWLVVLQVLALVGGSLVVREHIGKQFLAMLAAAQLLAALTLLRASLHTWRHMEPFTSAEALPDKQLPSLSVLIPARDETDALEHCLRRLIASDYPKLEILVLDDNSTSRRTPEIIRGFARDGVRFIQSATADETNWLAKNHAYERLRAEASGELLLFCGVDALLQPDSLRLLVEVLLQRGKDMLSVLPLKDDSVHTRASLLQPMRYYWEICLPRRFFKRPPVLSTCWLIRAASLDRAGGFEAVARSVTPEAYFARHAVVTDAYSFIRSNGTLGIYSAKPVTEQYDTSVRMRYPQLHRRLELVAVTTLLELGLLLGPIIGLFCIYLVYHAMAFAAIWGVATAALLVTYYLVAVATRLNNPLLAWLLMPLAFAYDIYMQHMSLFKYEFSSVKWKGRDIAGPVMQVIPRLPAVK